MAFRRKLADDLKHLSDNPTAKKQATLTETGNKLRRQIFQWIDVQALFIPRLPALRARDERIRAAAAPIEGVPPVKVQNIQLYLPSALVAFLPCDRELQQYEWRLREAQARDALEEMRHVLRFRSQSYKFKDQNVRGVHNNTRSKKAIAKLDRRIAVAAETYRMARKALEALAPAVGVPGWEKELRVLAQADIRGLSEGLYGDTEGTKTPSWIWLTIGVAKSADDDPGMNECKLQLADVV